MVCSVAGITSDANVLTNELRLIAQRYLAQYGESMPCEQLVSALCDMKQAYTQYGGKYCFTFIFIFVLNYIFRVFHEPCRLSDFGSCMYIFQASDHLEFLFYIWAGTNTMDTSFTSRTQVEIMVVGRQHVLVTIVRYVVTYKSTLSLLVGIKCCEINFILPLFFGLVWKHKFS